MNKLIAISTGTKNVDMAPGNIPCVVINNDFVKLCNKYGSTAVIVGPQDLDNINISKSKLLQKVEKKFLEKNMMNILYI